MPKRKTDKRDKYDYLSKKLKKLERDIKRVRRVSSSSSDCDPVTPYKQNESESIAIDDDYATNGGNTDLPGCSYWNPTPAYLTSDEELPAPNVLDSSAIDTNGVPTNSQLNATVPVCPQTSMAPVPEATAVLQPPSTEVAELVHASALPPDVPELDADLMEILGEDPTSIKEDGGEIQKDLAIRLNHIATSGLSKDNLKELKERYLVPANCKLIRAPTLNPEIRASLIDSQSKRDKGIENKQVLTSCALSSLSEAITLILASGQKNSELLKLLMDTARILGDIQYTDSISRRAFILSTVKKELKDQLDKTKIEEMLFGSNLSDTLKSAKIIIKSGADIRSASTIKSSAQKPIKNNNRPLNYRAPPAGRRQLPPPGGARQARAASSTQTPRQTTRTTHSNASRTSSRQPQPRQRR